MYTGKEIIREDAYLYSTWNGLIVIYRGQVVGDPCNGRARFIGYKRLHQCSSYEGEVFNGFVWLTDRDDQKARKFLISSRELAIKFAELKISLDKEKIKMIESADIIMYERRK